MLVDGIGIGDVGSVVMRDRKMLSEDGLLIAIMALDSKTGKLSANPEVISRGFVYVKENELMMDEVRDIIKKIIFENEDKYSPGDWTSLKSTLRSAIRSYLYSKTQRNPMILPVIIETGGRLL